MDNDNAFVTMELLKESYQLTGAINVEAALFYNGQVLPRAMLNVKNLTIRVNESPNGENARLLVDELSLSLGPGEVVCVSGRSGCGKSRLLRAICGLDPSPRGTSTSLILESVPSGHEGRNLLPMQLTQHQTFGRTWADSFVHPMWRSAVR